MSPVDRNEQFAEIYAAQRESVHAYFLGRTGDRELAADLTQETFLRAWRRLPEIAALDSDRQRAWIFTVARNLTIDTYRSRATATATRTALEQQAAGSAPDHEEPEPQVVLTEQITQLDKAIRSLPDKLRIALTMHAVAGMTSAQIGAALNEPAGTIRYRLNQARRKLAATMPQESLA
jgi:RNA polymerase sigma-70 factor (ECF subfamily)